MFNLDVAPPLFEVFRDEAAMAMMGFVFAAQQATFIELGAIDGFYSSLRHQLQKLLCIVRPAAM